jgi:hypothetical protein
VTDVVAVARVADATIPGPVLSFPANPLFTRGGGDCWTNDSPQLLGIPVHQDPRLHPRNQCIHQGYSSVALVPTRTQDEIVGLIQFNDRRKGCFTLDMVRLLEGIEPDRLTMSQLYWMG